ncbi:MAG: hypothetical protein U0T85_08585 [Cloacibacterium normanense]
MFRFYRGSWVFENQKQENSVSKEGNAGFNQIIKGHQFVAQKFS